jgi:hypothetical protein
VDTLSTIKEEIMVTAISGELRDLVIESHCITQGPIKIARLKAIKNLKLKNIKTKDVNKWVPAMNADLELDNLHLDTTVVYFLLLANRIGAHGDSY